ncbi:hypothetical protein [Bacillus pumilus]|uniref:hypothetical protein n=1 Tax=Bacillus pumilus TaxID=1408 RepID=UPI0011E8BF05|nr:hypothetical protein [Bacillus pumilus]TYS31746.1 hypothetical protein FZC65_11010 [Bacillus pumilus]TYS47384.1 hypothetical protein FZC67_10580 [Bacillus pumilus]
MKKVLSVILGVAMLFSATGFMKPAAAESEVADEKSQIRNYVETNVALLKKTLDNLPQNTNSDQVNNAIEKHFATYPTPQKYTNTSLDAFEVFPELKQKYEKFNVRETDTKSPFSEPVNTDPFEKIYTFKNDDGVTKVMLGKLGDIQVHQNTSKVTSADASTQAVTKTEKSVTIAYAVVGGGKIFTLWAEGRFDYNKKKKTVKVVHKDGDVNRHFSGTVFSITPRALGEARDASHGGYVYKEVFSRVYVEGILGFKWAGVVVNSGTFEVFVGSGSNGAVYGGQKKI